MSEFHKEVGTLFGLSESHSEQLEQGLTALADDFSQADQIEDQQFSARFYQQFEQLVKACALTLDEIEALVNVLYFTTEHQALVTYIVPSYYNAGGDVEMFTDTYQLMMDAVQ